jgi:bifunctional non-homologous end joining protein LigD
MLVKHEGRALWRSSGGRRGEANPNPSQSNEKKDDMTQSKNVTLYCREGGSDKVYQISLQARDGGWVVDFANGARGKALRTGTKIATPVAYEEAARVYDKLVREKTAKGYTSSETGVAYTNTEHEQRASGQQPQLPTPIDESELERYLLDDLWLMQEKRDGENRQVQVSCDGAVRGINRKSLFVDIPVAWAQDFRRLGPCLVAGEDMGEGFEAFDLLEFAGQDLRAMPFVKRHNLLLEKSAALAPLPAFRVLAVHQGPAKRGQLEALRARHAEGVVFKHRDGVFEPGRSDLQVKFKFVESATCIVIRRNQQRSVAVGLLDDAGSLRELGNVTVPANAQMPQQDALIEVQYLYRYENGCFEQPVFLRQRPDIDRDAARISQIRRVKRKSMGTFA